MYTLIYHSFWATGWILLIDISFYSYWGENNNSENPVSQFPVDEKIIFGNFVFVLLKSGVIKITQVFNFFSRDQLNRNWFLFKCFT